jgi:hypothetical protein
MLTMDNVYLFINENRITQDVEQHFIDENLLNIQIHDYNNIIADLKEIVSNITTFCFKG